MHTEITATVSSAYSPRLIALFSRYFGRLRNERALSALQRTRQRPEYRKYGGDFSCSKKIDYV